MISKNLLTAKGTIDAIVLLTFEQDGMTPYELAGETDVSVSTLRTRLNALTNANLVIEAAELRDDQPVRVFRTTTEGKELGTKLASILDDADFISGDEDVSESATDDEDVVEAAREVVQTDAHE